MTPEELARRVPRLYHVARPGTRDGIERLGLMSAQDICDLAGVTGARRHALLATPRASGQVIETRVGTGVEAQGGVGIERFTLNDNRPIVLRSLATCLDDGLRPEDWLRILNGYVFFWTKQAHAMKLARARNNRDEGRVVLAFDTLSLARAHLPAMAASPINSGDTTRKPPRRGRHTFAPLAEIEFDEWRTARRRMGYRSGNDTFKEIVVEGAVPDASEHLIGQVAVT